MKNEQALKVIRTVAMLMLCVFLIMPNQLYATTMETVSNSEQENNLKADKNASVEKEDVSLSSNAVDMNDRHGGIPIWGNWCGPRYGGGPPIDLLDAGCKTHENTYVYGGNNFDCNRKLIDYINKNLDRMTSGQRAMAKLIKKYFITENIINGS